MAPGDLDRRRAQYLGNNVSGAMPIAATVKSITVKGYWTGEGLPTILFQVLRSNGTTLTVVETSQPFTLPGTPGTYTFSPTNMTVQPGDYIGIATLGGSFQIATAATGASTNDFSGHEQDRNNDTITPTVVETNIELLLQVDLVPTESSIKQGAGKPPPPPPPPPKKKKKAKNKACKCTKMSVKIDPTLINKRRVPPDKHAFGVGFSWTMTCTEGKGGCKGFLEFKPPVIRAGTLPKVPGLKLNLVSLTFVCKAACKKSTTGRFEIKMKSREQLNTLFGRTLAFTIVTRCGAIKTAYLVNVFVDNNGRLHPSH